jgi:hypothetical protein
MATPAMLSLFSAMAFSQKVAISLLSSIFVAVRRHADSFSFRGDPFSSSVIRLMLISGASAMKKQHRRFNVPQDILLIVVHVHPHRVNLGPEQLGREDMPMLCLRVGVSELELFLGQLAIHIKDWLHPGNMLCYLDCKDGLAQVGIGK